ncbi:hypothetical protein EDB87DRAFT_1577332 [Lactarius vividus]|nr:hypothetical protein EDB87DRAFT_1577332 [Lactarius vividus]
MTALAVEDDERHYRFPRIQLSDVTGLQTKRRSARISGLCPRSAATTYLTEGPFAGQDLRPDERAIIWRSDERQQIWSVHDTSSVVNPEKRIPFIGSLAFPWFEARFHRKPEETHPLCVTSHVFLSVHAETIDQLHLTLGLVPTYSKRVRKEWNRVYIILTDKTAWYSGPSTGNSSNGTLPAESTNHKVECGSLIGKPKSV